MISNVDPLAGHRGAGVRELPLDTTCVVTLSDGRTSYWQAPGLKVSDGDLVLLGADGAPTAVLARGCWAFAGGLDAAAGLRGLLAVRDPAPVPPIRKRIETDDEGRIVAVVEE